MEEHSPKSIGPYQITGKIADGGMGRLYLASRVAEGGVTVDCVIKTIRPDLAQNEKYAFMFMHEARITASLSHPNIVRILDFDRTKDGALYLVMEHVKGRDLKDMLLQANGLGTAMPNFIALRIMIEVLKGLEHAHRNGSVVHRDISPNNILVSDQGEVKITDFGVAKGVVSESTGQGEMKGKYHYMPPEVIDGARADHRSDIYCAGLVLYELLTGHKAYDGYSVSEIFAKILNGVYEPVSVGGRAPADMDFIIAKALKVSPKKRYQTATEMLADLEQALLEIGPGKSTDLRDFFQSLYELNQEQNESSTAGGFQETRTTITPVIETLQKKQLKKRRRFWGKRIFLLFILLAVSASTAYFLPREKVKKDDSVISITVIPDPLQKPAKTTKSVEKEHPGEAYAPSKNYKSDSKPVSKKPEAKLSEVPNPEKIKKITPPAETMVPGKILVGDLAPFARVYINGEYFDDTPTKVLSLSPGSYQIKLHNPKLAKTANLNVQIKSGETTPILSWP